MLLVCTGKMSRNREFIFIGSVEQTFEISEDKIFAQNVKDISQNIKVDAMKDKKTSKRVRGKANCFGHQTVLQLA